MTSSLLESVERLRTGLDYHLARHNILVSNLAQSETPNYKAADLARTDFEGQLTTELAATNSAHIGAAGGASPFHVIEDANAKAGADGNSVDVDREAVKIATNQIRYDMLAQLASSELAGIEWAATDGKTG